MSIATDNRVTELESQVKRLIEQVEQLNKALKPMNPIIALPKRRGRPPANTGHI